MMIEAITLTVLAALVIWAAYQLNKAGEEAEKLKQAEDALEQINKANRARRDVAVGGMPANDPYNRDGKL